MRRGYSRRSCDLSSTGVPTRVEEGGAMAYLNGGRRTAAAALVLSILACGGGGTAPATGPSSLPHESLTVAVTSPNSTVAQVALADSLGAFRKQNLDVQVMVIPAGNIVGAVVAGQV